MTEPLMQHQVEIERNLLAWNDKPLLRNIYAGFYRRILALIDPAIPGRIVEIGSGIGNLKAHLPGAVTTDLFANPWLDLACDGYELPFRSASLSHLVLFNVFHHLRAPNAFLREARRVLVPAGRLVLFEPYISWSSWLSRWPRMFGGRCLVGLRPVQRVSHAATRRMPATSGIR